MSRRLGKLPIPTREPPVPRQKQARMQIGDYQFIKRGISRFDARDPYHLAITLSWPQFLLGLFGVYLAVNTIFAILYALVPGALTNAHPHSFLDAFFFSFETLATVGYGEMYPGSLYGHLVASAEIVCGIAFTAILTGLTFVRFSRPRAKFVMADKLVVTAHNGKPTLMLRVGNGRANVLADANAKLNVLLSDVTAEGARFRRAQELRLLRAHLPMFPLTWTLMHVMDETSPLAGFDQARFITADARVFFTLEARDPMLGAVVHDLRTYAPQDVLFGMRYADAVFTAEDGSPIADLTLISTVEADDGRDRPEQGWADVRRDDLDQA
jgi:inward rectifier potassium channel